MVKVIQKLFAVMEQLDQVRWISLSSLARDTRIPKATLCNQLRTLQLLGYVENNGGSYRLSEKFCRIGQAAAASGKLERLSLAVCAELAERTRESAVIAILKDCRISIVAQVRYPQTFMVDVSIYRNLSLWHSTSGRVLLAFSSPETVKQILRLSGYPGERWDGISSDSGLEKAMAPIRTSGLAVMNNPQDGLTAYSCPFFDEADRLCGTIGMTVPHQRLKGRDSAILKELRASAEKLNAWNAENHFSAWDWSKTRN